MYFRFNLLMYINIANSRENLRNLKCQVVYNMIGDVVIKILLSIGMPI